MTGATIRHGPHQAAQKSTSETPLCCSISVEKLPSVTVTVLPFSAISDSFAEGFPRLTRAHSSCYLRDSEVAKNWPYVCPEPLVELRLDHVAIAVPSITAALPVFELLANASGSQVERGEAQKVDVAFVGTGDG